MHFDIQSLLKLDCINYIIKACLQNSPSAIFTVAMEKDKHLNGCLKAVPTQIYTWCPSDTVKVRFKKPLE